MKLRKTLSLLLAVLLAVSAATFTFGASAAETVKDLVIPYSTMQKGIVDHHDARGFLEVVDDPDKGEVFRIAPNPNSPENASLTVDGYGAAKFNIDVTKYKYLIVEYKLHMNTADKIIPHVLIMKSNVFTQGFNFAATAPLVQDEWSTVVFNIRSCEDALVDRDNPYVTQFHFSPFGTKQMVTDMKDGDYMLVANWIFSAKNPLADKEYTVTFVSGDPTATGTAPAPIKAKADDVIELPQIPFTNEEKTAAGWMPSTGTTPVAAGGKFTMPPSDVTFAVNWKGEFDGEDLLEFELSPYISGTADHLQTADVEKDYLYEDRNVIKVVPNTVGPNKEKAINLDGSRYASAKINIDFYNTVIILYKYVSKNPVTGTGNLSIMKKDNFTGGVGNPSMDNIVANRWASISFSMKKAQGMLIPGAEPLLKQLHYYPLGTKLVQDLDPDDCIYVYKMLATPIKATGSAYHESYIKGYSDGTFGVTGNMTRAEACTIVARLVAGGDDLVPTNLTSSFTDVTAGDWFCKYVAYCEKLGYLKSYSGAFLPNQNITRAEFVELVYNMGLLSDNEKNGVFTDVAADHPRYNVITAAGKAGLVNGYDNGDGTFCFKPDNTINRAEVVKVINNAYGKQCAADGVFASAKKLFKDVDESHWAYAEILDAAVAHVSVISEETGKEVWIYSPDGAVVAEADDFEPDYAAGEKFVKDTEAKIDARRAEIRNTKSDYKEATGKVWYISNNGSDENDGTSPEKPFATVVKANNAATKGDAVLFERGGEWRGVWSSKAGIVYSAYGEGPKPIINGSTEDNATGADNWELVEGTTNVYKYKNALLDVGAIFYNDGEKVAQKLVPRLTGDEMYVDGGLFDPKYSFKKNDTFFCAYQTVASSNVVLRNTLADIYVRCDEGNPGAIYKSIEFATKNHAIDGNASNVIYDNLCIKYAGQHGIGGIGGSSNVTVRNCEIGWIGGCAQTVSNGVMIRLGNGVEAFGDCDGFYIDNCYVYECYDAGVTHQFSGGVGGACLEQDVAYTNNLIERCIYNVEYFMGKPDGSAERLMKNILVKDNILAKSGTGWGADPNRSASIKGWESYNRAENFTIEGNTFFMDYMNACDLSADSPMWLPVFKNNTYCQYYDHTFTRIGASGATQYYLTGATAEKLAKTGETGATIYFVKP